MNKGDLKTVLVKLAADRGFFICKRAETKKVKRFLECLHPVTTTKELARFGQQGDGGYLMPNHLDGVVACFSPGVDVKASFEADMVKRGIPCFLADASVSGPPFSHPLIHFQKKFLGIVEDESTTTLDKWVNDNAPDHGDMILQMDIEGGEWLVLLTASENVLKRFRIIVIEFHAMERLIDPFAFDVISAALGRLLRFLNVVHIHPNNHTAARLGAGLTLPRYIEMTFLRRDCAPITGYAKQFPHPLDVPNEPSPPDYPLPADWYRSTP